MGRVFAFGNAARWLLATAMVALLLACAGSAWADEQDAAQPAASAAAGEAEPNDTLTQANSLAAGQALAGTLASAQDVDCFRLNVPQDCKLTLSLLGTAADAGYWRVELLDAAGAEVASRTCDATAFTTGAAQVCASTGLAKGTYYVKVSGPSLPVAAAAVENLEYRVSARLGSGTGWEAEFNDTPATANSLALGSAIRGTARPGSALDDDWFRVRLSKAGTLSLTFQGEYRASGFWTAYLYRESDTSAPVASATYYATTGGSKRLLSKELDAGAYYVKVEGSAQVHNLEYRLDAERLPSVLSASVSPIRAKAYTGKEIKPVPTAKLGGKTLRNGVDFKLEYRRNIRVGTATLVIVGQGGYAGQKAVTFEIAKAANPMKVSAKAKSVKASKLRKAPVEISGAIRVSGAKGTVTYAKVAKGSAKQLTVRTSNGKITVAKGTPKGTYKLKVKVSARGSSAYKPATKTITLTVKVK